jgi:hypothetical protein
MNKMKDFLINNAPELKECFSWRTHTIPAAFKIKSVGFLKALQVSALSGVALGASTTFISFYRGCADVAWNRSLIIAGITTFIYMVGIYFMPLFFAKSARDLRLLKKEKKEAQANNDDQ